MATEKENVAETIIQQILDKKPEVSKEQVQMRLSVARGMTGGLIADASLLKMIAAELGAEIPNGDAVFNRRLSLGHLVAGLNNATVVGRVVAVFPVKTFEGAKPGKFAGVTIADNDGVARVILWNDKADVVEGCSLQVGQIVRFAHGYTKADKFGVPELHMGERSQVDLNPQNVRQEDYPHIDKFATKIKQLNPNQKSVNLTGKVTDVFGSSTFLRGDQTAGKVLRLKVADETGEAVVVFWNEKAEEVESKAKRNAKIEVVNAKVKLSQNGETEVHVDFASYVNVATPERCLVKIDSLAEDSGDVCVEGEVASIPVCREVKTGKGETVKVTGFDLRDDSGSIRVNAWREHAEAAAKLFMGERLMLENVYAKVGYNGGLELSTRAASVLSRVLK
jgi:ssDNA-binding replication factor A large subunit